MNRDSNTTGESPKILPLREQLTELQRQENRAYEQMRRCEDDYWPDTYPDARDKYHAVLAKVDALIDKLKEAEAQGGEPCSY